MRLHATAIFRPRSDLGRFIDVRATPAVKAAVEASCKLIENSAKAMVPVDTGALQASIYTTLYEQGRTIIGRVGPHVFYGPYVEFGTGIAGAASAGAGEGPYNTSWPGMPAQPYMRPALDENRGPIGDVFRKEIGLAFNK